MAKGLVKALGLSNFSSRQIDDVLSVASVRPAVLQVSTTNRPMESVIRWGITVVEVASCQKCC